MRPHSLLWKYAAYSSALVAALLLAVGAVTAWFTYRDTTEAQDALLREKAGAVASRISAFIATIEDPLAWTVATATNTGADDAELRVEMTRLLQRLPPVTEMRWIDPQGRERLYLSRFELDAANSGADYSKDARYLAARGGGIHASPVYFRRESEPNISLAVGGRSSGGGVLIAEVNLRFVWDVVSRERIGTQGRAYVVDAAGLLVSHPEMSLVLARTDLSALPHVSDAIARLPSPRTRAHDLEGRSVLTLGAPVPRVGWTVFAELPAREALAPVYAGIVQTIALGGLGLLLALAGSYLLARRMVRPIRQLGEGAERIGSGHLDHRIHVGTGDELDALATQLNRMAERLQESYLTLEARIAERTEQLAAANRAKTQFLAAASHDLRQPMHALALTVGELRESVQSPTVAPLVRRMDRSVDALQDLLDALLDISRLDAGGVTPARRIVPVAAMIERLADELGPVAEAKGLRFNVMPTSLWTETDPTLLGRILLNLAGNAVRYTREGGVVVGCRRRGSEAEIVVADSGIGIADEDLHRIFQEFYQAGNPEHDRAKGLGLGLAIVERTARLLGHPIGVRSRIGRGSVFTIRVPVVAPPQAAPEAAQPAQGPTELAGVRVLVVDDESDVRAALCGLIERWGCSTVAAANLDEALAGSSNGFDVVLCDLHLANGANGLDVLDRLVGPGSGPVRGVVVTADAAPQTMEQVRARGYPLLHKPLRPARLRALLEQLVRPQTGR